MNEIQQFFTNNKEDLRPAFSEVMEDYSVISDALNLSEGDYLISISSAGDNVLNAVLEPIQHIYSVDINPLQTSFCKFKESAILDLNWKEFLEIMGVIDVPPDKRKQHIKKINLENTLSAYSDQNYIDLISEKGLVSFSHLDLFLKSLRFGLSSIIGTKNIENILTETDSIKRHKIWEELFDSKVVLKYLSETLNENTISGAFIPKWAFNKMSESQFYSFFHQVLKHQLVELDPCSNYYMHRLLLGSFPSVNDVPPYLKKKNYRYLQTRLPYISWYTSDLLTFLKSLADNSINAFNLSNVLDWCDDQRFKAIWSQVDRIATSDARVFLRSFLVERGIQLSVINRWKLDIDKSENMKIRDRVGYYSRYELWQHL